MSYRRKYKKADATVQVGDIVLVENEMQKRLHWSLARVQEAFPGTDKGLRAVRLKTSKGELIRAIQRLIALEVESDCSPESCLVNSVVKKNSTVAVKETLSHPQEDRVSPTKLAKTRRRSGRLVL